MRSLPPHQQNEQQLLLLAESYLQEFVFPNAAAIDEKPEALRRALQGLGDRALLALQIPTTGQDAPLSQENFYRFQELVARSSGALAFLQTQHQSAGSLLVNGTNDSLKQEILPHMATGKILVGVGFSQLRRQGEPLMKATPVEGGYQLDGTVPWVTGYSFFDHFIIGATLPTGDAVYGLLPLQEMTQPSGGNLCFSEPMQLVAMESTQTVSAQSSGWFLPCDRVVIRQPHAHLPEKDQRNVLQHSFFALGCARAGLEILQDIYQKTSLPFLSRTYQALDRELEDCRKQIYQALHPQQDHFEPRLHLRAWAIDLAGRCTRAAVTASSGAANLKSHPAGRVYRESLMFAVSGQTRSVMEATLKHLLARESLVPGAVLLDPPLNVKKC